MRSSSLAPSNSGFAPRPLMSGRCLHGGAGLIITPLHPAFLATGAVISSAPVLGCSWWLFASRPVSPTRLQLSPSPESHKLDPSLLTSQAQERLPWAPEVGEGLRGVGGPPSKISGHFFQMAPRDHQARVIRKGGVGTDQFLSSKQGCGW